MALYDSVLFDYHSSNVLLRTYPAMLLSLGKKNLSFRYFVCLFDFFKQGVVKIAKEKQSKLHRKIASEVPAYIGESVLSL